MYTIKSYFNVTPVTKDGFLDTVGFVVDGAGQGALRQVRSQFPMAKVVLMFFGINDKSVLPSLNRW